MPLTDWAFDLLEKIRGEERIKELMVRVKRE